MAVLSCGESDFTVNVDLLPLLDVADVNFHSPTYTADSELPLNADLPAGTQKSNRRTVAKVRR